MSCSFWYLSAHVFMLFSTEAAVAARVGEPEDSLFGTFRSGLSATGEPATLQD